MRFLHLSDLHLGKRVCEFSMLDDQRYILEQILSLLDTHPVDAVLLAGGPCWEGVDFPGDGVSLLVIVRLPFPVPDPVREARREQYPDLHTYIQAEIVPEMQQKLRQGFGRAIRTETDSCAVAILDPRAAPGGRYHRAVLDALPAGIPITTNIEDIQTFLRARKSPDFFLPDFENDSKQSDSKTNTK